MLTAIVNKDLYRYEINSLIKAFYPEETVKVLAWGDSDTSPNVRMAANTSGAPLPSVTAGTSEAPLPSVTAGTSEAPLPSVTAGTSEAPLLSAKAADTSEAPFLFVKYSESKLTVSVKTSDKPPVSAEHTGSKCDEKSAELKNELKHMLYRVLSEETGRELPWGELIGIRPTKLAMMHIDGGATDDETVQYMMDEHRVSRGKAGLAVEIARREKIILQNIHYENGYSLYIGIPFCPTTCLYCSFTSFPLATWRDRVDTYLDALIHEIEATTHMMKSRGKVLDTVYIGGGTPTTLEPEQLDRLLNAIEENFKGETKRSSESSESQTDSQICYHEPLKHQTDCQNSRSKLLQDSDSGQHSFASTLQEFTVEAGRPDSITPDKLAMLQKHGVGRISVNPQTMNDRTLELIGRRHSVQQVIDAFHMAREAGFDNINMDIILGLPEETEEDVHRTIDEISKLHPDDLTVHSLALKRASRMQQWIEQNGFTSIHNTDETMKIAADGAAAMGLEPYYLYRQKNMSGNFENVGYAAPGKAGIYNILIMEEKQTILALGAGAITKRVFPGGRIERCDNAKDVATYIANIDEMIERKEKLFAE